MQDGLVFQYIQTMKQFMTILTLSMALPLTIQHLAAQETVQPDPVPQDFVLADFPAGLAQAPGWQWEGFADRVMGGKSDLVSPGIVNTPDGPAYRLAGKVITKGGGFIQVRLDRLAGPFNASDFSGVEVIVDAPAGGKYYVFLRTRDNFFPWSYYGALLDLPGGRRTIRLPWTAFKAEATLRRDVRTTGIANVALVAAYLDFEPDLKIYRVAFYR
jgi:hypothetical protein